MTTRGVEPRVQSGYGVKEPRRARHLCPTMLAGGRNIMGVMGWNDFPILYGASAGERGRNGVPRRITRAHRCSCSVHLLQAFGFPRSLLAWHRATAWVARTVASSTIRDGCRATVSLLRFCGPHRAVPG